MDVVHGEDVYDYDYEYSFCSNISFCASPTHVLEAGKISNSSIDLYNSVA
jgi:hypothetical protein